MMRLAGLLFFCLFPMLLQAADPAPFADLKDGPSAPLRFKSTVFRKKLFALDGDDRNILSRSYYYDYISRRYLLQPGLPAEAVAAVDRILSGRDTTSGFFRRLWDGFIRINSGIQNRVAILLKRVVKELPLNSMHVLPDGKGVFFTSPATRGLRVFFRVQDGFVESGIPGSYPAIPLVLPLKSSGYLGALIDREQRMLLLRFFSDSGEPGAVNRIPYVTGSRLAAASLTDRRVLLAWQTRKGVSGGYYDSDTGKFRRFRPLAGFHLPEQKSGSGGIFLLRGRTLFRLQWDGARGVRSPRNTGTVPGGASFSIYREPDRDYLICSDAVFSRIRGTGKFSRLFAGTGKSRLRYCGDGFYLYLSAGHLVLYRRREKIKTFRFGNTGKLLASGVDTGVLKLYLQESAAGGRVYCYSKKIALPPEAEWNNGLLFGSSPVLLAFLLLLISFVYGFVHSSGPGHGKALVAAYFVDHPHRGWFPPVKMALIVSATHTGSALLIAVLFQLILTVAPDHMLIRKWFTVFSASVVILLGVYMLVDRFRGHAHTDERNASGKGMFALGVAAGIVPCPLAMGIMVISIMNGVFLLGILSVLGMSAGMFLLLLLVGGLTSRSRDRLERFLEGRGKMGDIFLKIAGVFSSLVIVVLGIALLTPVL